MVNKKLVNNPVFSLRLGSSEADGGEVIFGGIDDSAYTGNITYIPLHRKAFWELELEKFVFGDDEIELQMTGAAIDTGEYHTYTCPNLFFTHLLTLQGLL